MRRSSGIYGRMRRRRLANTDHSKPELSPLIGRRKRIAVETTLDYHSPQPPPSSRVSHHTNSSHSPHFATPSRLTQLRSEHSNLLHILQERNRKQRLAVLLKKRYGATFSRAKIETSSKECLVNEAVLKWQRTIALKAARQLQLWLSQVRIDRIHREIKAKEHLAAYRIQIYWKKYRFSVISTREKTAEMTKKVVLIQAWFRGYQTRMEVNKAKMKAKIENLSRHFRLMRVQIQYTSAVKIETAWKRYKVRVT